MHNSEITIKGQKILLRDWTINDLNEFQKWQLPGLKWQSLDGPYYHKNVDESQAITEHLKTHITNLDFENPRMQLAISDISSNKILGKVASYWESIETNWLCIGIVIFDPDFWGKGVGADAMKLWIDYLFENRPEIVRLDMRTWSGNSGLIGLAKKLHFTQEACFRQARIVDGKYYDGLGFGILRSEWETISKN